jgi:hypothetical protein
MRREDRRKFLCEFLAFLAVTGIIIFLILTAIDNMPPSADELSGKTSMGPVNSAYEVTK